MLKLPQTIKEQIVSNLSFEDTFEFSLVNKECYHLAFPERIPPENECVSTFHALLLSQVPFEKKNTCSALYRQLLGKEPTVNDDWIRCAEFYEQFRCLEEIAKQIYQRRLSCGLKPGKIWLSLDFECHCEYCDRQFDFDDDLPIGIMMKLPDVENLEMYIDWAEESGFAELVHTLRIEGDTGEGDVDDLAYLCSLLPNVHMFDVSGSCLVIEMCCECLKEMPQLKAINVNDTCLTESFLKEIFDTLLAFNPEVVDVRIGEGAVYDAITTGHVFSQFLEVRKTLERFDCDEVIIYKPVNIGALFGGLRGHTRLRHLNISGSCFIDTLGVTSLHEILKDTKLEILCLDLDSSTKESLQAFKDLLLACPYLKYLKVKFNIVPEDETYVEPLLDISKRLSNIQMVHIGVVHETSSFFKLVALALVRGKGLRHLTFGLYEVEELSSLEVDLSNLELLFKAIKANKSLLSLEIGGIYFDRTCYRAFGQAFRVNQTISHLNLAHCFGPPTSFIKEFVHYNKTLSVVLNESCLDEDEEWCMDSSIENYRNGDGLFPFQIVEVDDADEDEGRYYSDGDYSSIYEYSDYYNEDTDGDEDVDDLADDFADRDFF